MSWLVDEPLSAATARGVGEELTGEKEEELIGGGGFMGFLAGL